MAKSRAVYFGFNPPFYGGPQNILSRQEDEKLIKNDILQLLLTVPGERVMRPLFGVPLRSFVFEQSTANSIQFLQGEILNAIAEFEPRVVVESISLTRDEERYGLDIKLIVRLVRNPTQLLTIEQFLGEEQQ